MGLLDKLRNKDKTRHHEGDLYYGYCEQYLESQSMMMHVRHLEKTASTLDELCHNSGLNDLLRNDKGNGDYVRGYFEMIEAIRNYHPLGTRQNQVDRWMLFLQNHLDYLSVDTTLAQLRAGKLSTLDAYKNRLTKNGTAAWSPETQEGFSNALLKAFDHGNYTQQDIDYEYAMHIDEWVSDLMFRKLSKLGIDFTIQEGKTVHFNIDSPSQIEGAAARIDHDMEALDATRVPITFSELRHLNRHYAQGAQGPGSHPQIDFHSTATDSIRRSPSMGDLSEYRENRKKAKKPKPRRG